MNTRIFSGLGKRVAYLSVALFVVVAFAVAPSAYAIVTGVTITAPNGTEAWNTTQNITWTCQDDTNLPDCSSSVVFNILYSPDGGTTWENAIDAATSLAYVGGSLFGDAGTFSWNTTTHTESSNGLIRIVMDSAGGINDQSDAPFTLDNTPPTIIGAVTNDSDGNGKIDELIVRFDESMNSAITSTAGITYVGYTLGTNGVWGSDTVANDILKIAVTEVGGVCNYSDQTGCDTDDTSNVAYDGLGTLTDLATNALTAYVATPATDGAKPAMVGGVIIDHNGNGILDLVSIRFSELLNAKIIGADNENAYFGISSVSDFAGLTEGNVVSDGNRNGTADLSDLSLVSYNFITTPLKTNVGDLAINYTTDVASMIVDSNGNVATSFTLSGSTIPVLGDEAAPIVIQRVYLDNDGDGIVDFVRLTWSEDVVDSTITASDFEVSLSNAIPVAGLTESYTSGTPSSGYETDVANDSITYVGITSGTETLTTNTTFYTNVYVMVVGSVDDNASNVSVVEATGTVADDKARPIVINDLALDTNGDGDVDTLELQFSENIIDFASQVGDWALSSNGTDWDVFSVFSTNTTVLGTPSIANDDYVSLSLTPSNVSGTGVMEYRYANGGTDITDNNTNPLQDISATSATDGAAPVITKVAYKDTNNDGTVETVEMTISEDLITVTPTITDFTISVAGDITLADGVGTAIAEFSAGVLRWTGLTADVAETGGATDPKIIYTQAGSTFQDAALNEMLNLTQTNIVDEALPVALDTVGVNNSQYMDSANTGAVTSTILRFTEGVDWRANYSDGNWTATPNGLTGFDVTSSTDGNGDSSLFLQAVSTNITGVGAGVKPTLAYPGGDIGNGTLEDAVGNMAAAFTVTLADAANPVLVGFVANPDPSGIGDTLTFDLTFSEDMDTSGALTDTGFGISPVTSTYGVNDDATAGHTFGFVDATPNIWEGNYGSNPIATGTPVSGTHTFDSVGSGKDPVGNGMAVLSGLDMTFAIDSLVPDTIGIVVDPTTQEVGKSITVTASASDDIGVQSAELFIDGVSFGAMTASDGSFGGTTELLTATVTVPAGTGVKEVYIIASDAVNKEVQDGDNTETFTATPSTTSDITAPWLSSTSPSTQQATGSVAPVEFVFGDDTGFNTNAILNIKDFVMDGASIAGSGNLSVTVTLSDKVLTVTYTDANMPAGVHNFNIRIKDAAGNTREASMTVDVIDPSDTTPPQFLNSTPANGAVNVSTSANTVSVKYDENVQIISGQETNIKIEKVGGASVKNGTASVSGDTLNINYIALDYGTSYKVTVPSSAIEDTSGNDSTANVIVYFTTQSASAPTITSLGVSSVTESSASVDWATATTPTSGEYRYGTASYTGTWTALTIGGASGSQALSGLSANTTYYYQVRFTKDGATVESIPLSFTTLVNDATVTQVTVTALNMVANANGSIGYATANDSFDDGWRWTFKMTVPTSETQFSMKFADFVSGGNTIVAANNIRLYSSQASASSVSTTAETITAANTYTTAITLDSDLDSSTAGRQIEVTVEMKVPTGSAGGSYSASYGVRSL